MNKSTIEAIARGGGRISGRDVAIVSRSGRVVRMRHAWQDNDDARVLDAVFRAVRQLARDVSRKTRRPVDVIGTRGEILLSDVDWIND